MRMEKINDRQVRCVITTQDLKMRKLSLSELKYGGKETSELFKEILMNARKEYNFNTEELPLMIEAIPISLEELLIIISAVEDAEELDPHFAHFSDTVDNTKAPQDSHSETFYEPETETKVASVCLIYFTGIDNVMTFCKTAGRSFPGGSELYAGNEEHSYYLALLKPSKMSGKDFLQYLNGILEYADLVENSPAVYGYLKEHNKPILSDPLKVFA